MLGEKRYQTEAKEGETGTSNLCKVKGGADIVIGR